MCINEGKVKKKLNTFDFNTFLGGGTLSSLYPGPKGGSNLKSSLERASDKCKRAHTTQNVFHVAEWKNPLFLTLP